MPYALHPSKQLVELFKKKPWQGADPADADFLFVGLDANYAPDIETTLPEIFEYHESGVEFWEKTGLHHPFRLPHYKGSGKKYHDKFAEIGFRPEHARLVSFVELLDVPTTGVSSLKVTDLSGEHLKALVRIFEHGTAKHVFLSSGVVKLLQNVGMFPWIPSTPLKTAGALDVLREIDGRKVYKMYHLSCYGWQMNVLNAQIKQIQSLVESQHA